MDIITFWIVITTFTWMAGLLFILFFPPVQIILTCNGIFALIALPIEFFRLRRQTEV